MLAFGCWLLDVGCWLLSGVSYEPVITNSTHTLHLDPANLCQNDQRIMNAIADDHH